MNAALLLLADGRFPSGGHAHSAGVEAACANGDITDVVTLQHFVAGRLHTIGLVEAAFAAAACAGHHPWSDLDDALDARIASPRLRDASRTLGRQLLRAGRRTWPHESLEQLALASAPAGPHQPVAMGAVARAAGLDAPDAAACSLHHLALALGTAALRLLGLDPFDVHALLAALAPTIDALARAAAVAPACSLDDLPAWSGPLTEILAEDHATWEVRLFAS
jgi:urease accessory protein